MQTALLMCKSGCFPRGPAPWTQARKANRNEAPATCIGYLLPRNK